ncbi:quercetin dioxygenase-like cupin family protein [Arthrobacter pigmenti]|uniref:Quercetin dioxygenase-like cupin family protein n=1 Tax=Arthrobacter pigmenti TaxID=271432 RepID=A0A846RTE8_9MICC|nr:cupin domain-containing protein [Arthrobacter pigmenti]NJC23792.1 quercetin dioxygenase-like cupin family protein [Arthrobacter pigmenti]
MRIINGPVQDGTAGKAGSRFSGIAYPYLTMVATDGVTINTVNFTPGARTYWHDHENGQILQVLAGRGLIQTADDDAPRVLNAGDTVWCPPGERHWHGAAADSFMTHTAISLGATHWAGPVDDADYNEIAELRKE